MSKSQKKYMFNGSFINYADRESSNEWARDEITGTDFCINLDNNIDKTLAKRLLDLKRSAALCMWCGMFHILKGDWVIIFTISILQYILNQYRANYAG